MNLDESRVIWMDLDESELAGAGSPNITYTAWEGCFEASRSGFLKLLKVLMSKVC